MRVVHSQGDVVRDDSGRPLRQFGVLQDITELRRAEDELSEIKERFRVLAESSLTGIYLTEQDRFTYVNPALAKMFGYEVEEVVGRRSIDLTCPDDRPLVAENMRRRLEGAVEEMRYEFRGLRKDGSVFPVEVHGRRIEHAGRIGVLGTLIDISERKRAEESLRESEAYLTEAQRLSHTGSWALDVASNRYLYTSEEFDRIFGFDPNGEKLTTEAILERMHPDDRISWKRILEKSVREKLDTTSQYRIVLPDGSIRHIHTIRRPVVNSAGEVVKLVGTSIDITERKRAEEELRASEARFRTFVDHATDAFFLHDDGLIVVDVNRQACDSLGYSREELIGMHPRDFDVGLDEPSLTRLAQRVGAGESVTFETLHRRKDGIVFPVEIRARMFQQADKRFRLSLARDISDRKLTEETLREKEDALQMARTELARVSRVMTMGELTASIAHEVNQPLGAMVANAAACARWLAAEPPEIAKTRRVLDSIAADGRRASEVIGRIRALVKRQAPRKVVLDINQKVRDMVALTEQELRRQEIVLELDLADGLPAVAGDRVQLQQVLLNLIVNAIEAMSAVHDRPRALTIVSRPDGPDAVAVEVRDSGTGLDAEPRRAAVRGVLHDQGRRDRHRPVDQPLDRRGARRNSVGGAQRAAWRCVSDLAAGGRARLAYPPMRDDRAVVFVIDDDPSMRGALGNLIGSVGLDAQLFASPQEFLQSKRPDVPSCLVLDVRMPGMSGLAFQQELARLGTCAAGDLPDRPRGRADERAGHEGGCRRIPHQAVPRPGASRCNPRGHRARPRAPPGRCDRRRDPPALQPAHRTRARSDEARRRRPTEQADRRRARCE